MENRPLRPQPRFDTAAPSLRTHYFPTSHHKNARDPEMSLILVVEPDTAQTEILETIVRERVGAELEFVTSAAAAIMAVSRRPPDLLLFGRAVSSLDQIVIVDYVRSLTQAAEVFALTIPELRTSDEPSAQPSGWFRLGKQAAQNSARWDPILFAEQITSTLARAEEVSGQLSTATSQLPSAESETGSETTDSEAPEDESSVASHELELELERARADAAEQRMRELALLQQEAEAAREAAVVQARREVEAMLASELARARDEAERTRRTCEQAQREADASRIAAAEAARDASEEGARALQREVARVRAEAEARLGSELSRVRREAEQTRLAEEQAQHQADARRIAAAEEACAASEDRARMLQAEIARVEAEAQARLERELAQARESTEVSRLEAQAAARLEAELARVRLDAEHARRAQEQAQQDAEAARAEAEQKARAAADGATHSLRIEIARVRADAQARLEQELVRVREEAERAQVVQSEAQREAEAQRDAVAAEARTAAEEAARLLQLEVARARAETEARFEAELAGVRSEAEQARRANHEARLEMQLLREQAARSEETLDRTLAEHHGRAAWAEGRDESSQRFVAHWTATSAPKPASARRHGGLLAAAAMVFLAVAGSLAFYLPRVNPSAQRVGSASETAAATDAVMRAAARESERAPARRAPRGFQAAASPDPAAAAPGRDAHMAGFVAVFSRIPLDLYVGDRRIGSTENGQLMLPPGHHRIRVTNDRFKFHDEFELDVRPGDLTSHTVPLPTAAIRVDTAPGAEVRIEGERVGTAPIGELQIPIGTREIIVTHPEMGERRQAVEVIYGETTDVTVAFAEEPVAAGTPRLAPLSAP